jgi:ubiquinol-cytochrome c reductase cytochrome c subunit
LNRRRVRQGIRLALALVCGAGAVSGFAARGAVPGGPPPSALTATGSPTATGQALFAVGCASCHGLDAAGIPGRGPNLRGVGALAADFYLQTGRMPLPDPRTEPQRAHPAYPPDQVRALVAYVASFGGPPIPNVDPGRGSTSHGEQLFAMQCAGCHTIQGQGGIVTGAVAPSLSRSTPTQIAEAVRIGPYVMPRFGARQITDPDLDSIARYVQSTQSPHNRGGWGLGRIGPIPEGMIAWFLGAAALLLIARMIGERSEL